MARTTSLEVKVKDKEVCVCVYAGVEGFEGSKSVFVSTGSSRGLTPDRYGPNYSIRCSVKRDWQHNHSFQFALKPYSHRGRCSNGMLM